MVAVAGEAVVHVGLVVALDTVGLELPETVLLLWEAAPVVA